MYALADCNNFYCSCERVFQPKLQECPVIVLSNNDGCVIARSNEVKALKIEMGTPFFQIKDMIRKHHITIRSSNYTLYADMSQRVLATLEEFSPEVENYSIDESFLHLAGFEQDLTEYARLMRSTVLKHTGIPVSIGIAPTKTLAKAANKLAKRSTTSGGVFTLPDAESQTRALRSLAVGDIWGVGHRYARMLNKHGIQTALELRNADLDWVRQKMTVVGLRMVMELRGQPCIPLGMEPEPNKQVVRSRAFGKPVTDLRELEEALAMHISTAAEKLRRQKLATEYITAFIRTNPFVPTDPQYSNTSTVRLPEATNDTTTLIECGMAALRHIYKPGYRYKKAGVMLNNLMPTNQIQLNLFLGYDNERLDRINQVLDKINHRYGRFCLRHAAMSFDHGWGMRREHCSPCYTTRWSDLPVVKA